MTTSPYTFTTYDILLRITFWEKEPLCNEAMSALLYHFAGDNNLGEEYSYKSDDIDAFIMETLSQITE